MEVLLQYLQNLHSKKGFIDEPDILDASKKFSKSPAEIFEAVTSYANFNLFQTSEKVIKICDSPTCHIKGGEKLINIAKKLLNTKIGINHKKFRLESCQCLSLCDKGPVMMINDEIYTNLTEEKLIQILKDEKLI